MFDVNTCELYLLCVNALGILMRRLAWRWASGCSWTPCSSKTQWTLVGAGHSDGDGDDFKLVVRDRLCYCTHRILRASSDLHWLHRVEEQTLPALALCGTGSPIGTRAPDNRSPHNRTSAKHMAHSGSAHYTFLIAKILK